MSVPNLSGKAGERSGNRSDLDRGALTVKTAHFIDGGSAQFLWLLQVILAGANLV
jgi:hypothetical protein